MSKYRRYSLEEKIQIVKEYLSGESSLREIGKRLGYKNKKGKVLMTAIPTKDYFKTSEGIKQIDNKAFFIVTDSYQMSNGA